LNASLEAAANIAESSKLICYNDEEGGDTAMSSLSESEIDDDDIRYVPSYLIGEAAATRVRSKVSRMLLSHY
jgi:hypothetical protein